jgi:hypothetical protein
MVYDQISGDVAAYIGSALVDVFDKCDIFLWAE